MKILEKIKIISWKIKCMNIAIGLEIAVILVTLVYKIHLNNLVIQGKLRHKIKFTPVFHLVKTGLIIGAHFQTAPETKIIKFISVIFKICKN